MKENGSRLLDKKNSSLLMIVGVLGVIVVGVSFAFYIASVSIIGTGERVTGNTANPYTVEYDAGTSKLESTELTPNHTVSKNFSVKVNSINNSVGTVTYAIKFDITSNTFAKCTDDNYNSVTNACLKNAEELSYTLKDGSGNVLKTGDITGYVGTIVMVKETKNTNVTATYNYTLEITFKETNADQNHNMNKTIAGSVEVEFASLDETIPVVDSINVTNTTRDSIAVSVVAHDMETADTEGIITKYYYSINDGAFVEKTLNTHTFEGLEANKKYNIKVQVEDNAGNKSEVKTIEASTKGASSTIIAGNNPKPGTNSFTKAATTAEESGLFSTQDDDGTTYYYRGVINNNWVDFAGFKWRIIRINGDGSIRMIYNGTDYSQTGTGTQIGTSEFNLTDNHNRYVGYMYGIEANDYENTHSNINSSTVKEVIDNWYKTNIADKNYDSYISKEAGFCGDRQVQPKSSLYQGNGGGTSTTSYAPDARLSSDSDWKKTQTPTYSCNTNDFYTISSSSKGNHALTYPVGLITSDEAVFAGAFGGFSNNSYWLYTSISYWTMSPRAYGWDHTYVIQIWSNGDLTNWGSIPYSSANLGVRPVINLSADVQLTGSGTTSDPFKVS